MQTSLNKIFYVFAFLIFIACNSNVMFNEYKSIPQGKWNANEKVSFEFSVLDTILKKNLFLNLRNNKDYKYSNLYLIATLKYPNGNKEVDTLQYEMADAEGNFLGAGFSDIKENKLFYKEAKLFKKSGNYTVEVTQAMRKNGDAVGLEYLEGILDVGLSVEKVN